MHSDGPLRPAPSVCASRPITPRTMIEYRANVVAMRYRQCYAGERNLAAGFDVCIPCRWGLAIAVTALGLMANGDKFASIGPVIGGFAVTTATTASAGLGLRFVVGALADRPQLAPLDPPDPDSHAGQGKSEPRQAKVNADFAMMPVVDQHSSNHHDINENRDGRHTDGPDPTDLALRGRGVRSP